MSDEHNSRGGDLLGIRPLTEAAGTLTKGLVDGAAAFLGRICLPFAEEFGLLLRDKVSQWRAANAARIAIKAQKKYEEVLARDDWHAHPRLVGSIIDHGSWVDDEEVQELWAGLLASSCTADGRDESNLIFVDTLGRLTVSQAHLLDHVCHHAGKVATTAGWISAQLYEMTLEQLKEVSGIEDFHRIDRELDHLRTLGLIAGGFNVHSTTADMTPTALALQMYVRCQGSNEDPLTFFGLSRPEGQGDAV